MTRRCVGLPDRPCGRRLAAHEVDRCEECHRASEQELGIDLFPARCEVCGARLWVEPHPPHTTQATAQ